MIYHYCIFRRLDCIYMDQKYPRYIHHCIYKHLDYHHKPHWYIFHHRLAHNDQFHFSYSHRHKDTVLELSTRLKKLKLSNYSHSNVYKRNNTNFYLTIVTFIADRIANPGSCRLTISMITLTLSRCNTNTTKTSW